MSHSPPPDDPSPVETGGLESPQKKLHRMLAGIWERSKQTIEQRVAILEEAVAAAQSGAMDETARLRAVDSAHKLAGVLGTFGLPRGTELAREAEEAFGKSTAMTPADLKRLAGLLEELESLVKTANLSSSQPDPH